LLHPGGGISLTQKLSKGVPKPRPILAAKKAEKGEQPPEGKRATEGSISTSPSRKKEASKQAKSKQQHPT
jgi:hypothetical protein